MKGGLKPESVCERVARERECVCFRERERAVEKVGIKVEFFSR